MFNLDANKGWNEEKDEVYSEFIVFHILWNDMHKKVVQKYKKQLI